MSFACWYSIDKNLPDAKIVVAYKRAEPKWDLFHWTRKCKIQLMAYVQEPAWDVFGGQFSIVVLPPHSLAIRSYNQKNVGPTDVKDNAFSTFVSYPNACGGFNTARWIDKLGAPFYKAVRRFGTSDCTADEIKVLELWERMCPLFSSM
jgi:hypothetical protein